MRSAGKHNIYFSKSFRRSSHNLVHQYSHHMASKPFVSRFENTDIARCTGYLALQASAKARGIPFTLSFKRYCQLLKAKKCFYTGTELNKSPNKSNNHFTFDRVDTTGPYSDSNTVPCIQRLNSRKTDLTIQEIEALYKGLRKKRLL